MREPDFYHVLHVQSDAPVEIIRTSYRTLMQKLARHPDLGGNTASAALINEAFETLTDPVRRAAYDQMLSSAEALEAESPGEAPASDGSSPQPDGLGVPARVCLFCGEPHVDRQSRMPDAHCACCGSPLCSAPTAARSTASRRGFHRTLQVIHVTCEVQGSRGPFDSVTENLSVAGLCLLSPLELAVDQIIRLDCEFCSAVGVVRYAHEASGRSRKWWQAGIEFKTLHLKQTRGGLVSTLA